MRAGGYLSQSNISAIFSNIEGILAVNTELLNYMKQSSLGDAFLYLGPFLKLYGSYSSNYQTAINILEVSNYKDTIYLYCQYQRVQVGGGGGVITMAQQLAINDFILFIEMPKNRRKI